jgi:hypothetical protein
MALGYWFRCAAAFPPRRRAEYLTWRAVVYRELGAVPIGYDAAGGPVLIGDPRHIGVSHGGGHAAVVQDPLLAVDIAQEQIQRIIETYILQREQMTCLFVLVDSRHEPQAIDLAFIEWLGENGVPFAIVFTKADKLKGGRINSNIRHYLEKLREQWEELPPHFITSSENRMGRDELLGYIEQINKEINSKS